MLLEILPARYGVNPRRLERRGKKHRGISRKQKNVFGEMKDIIHTRCVMDNVTHAVPPTESLFVLQRVAKDDSIFLNQGLNLGSVAFRTCKNDHSEAK